jgi:hypothetical protein
MNADNADLRINIALLSSNATVSKSGSVSRSKHSLGVIIKMNTSKSLTWLVDTSALGQQKYTGLNFGSVYRLSKLNGYRNL